MKRTVRKLFSYRIANELSRYVVIFNALLMAHHIALQVPIHPTPKSQFAADRTHFPLLPPQTVQKPNIDRAFISQFRAILFRVAIPSWYSSEAGIVALHSSFLVLRTILSILVARLDGRIVRDLVKADGKGFLKGLGLWFLLAIPSTITNSMVSLTNPLDASCVKKCRFGTCNLSLHCACELGSLDIFMTYTCLLIQIYVTIGHQAISKELTSILRLMLTRGRTQ